MTRSTSIINLYILEDEIYLFPSVSKGDGGASRGIGSYEVINKEELIRYQIQRGISENGI